LFLLLAASISFACSSSTPPKENVQQVSQPIVPSTRLAVPIRWCVVGDDANANGMFDPGEKGVPAFTNPEFVSPQQPNTDIILWRRHERISDKIYIPGANITYRSALTQPSALGGNIFHFPIIPDQDLRVGQYGDQLYFEPGVTCQRLPIFPTDTDAINAANAERDKLLFACVDAWKKILDVGESVNNIGIIAMNVRRFVQPVWGDHELGRFRLVQGPSVLPSVRAHPGQRVFA